jgi:hypothetical protein
MSGRAQRIAFSLLLSMAFAASVRAVQEPQLTEDEMKQFLLTAKVIKDKGAPKGITGVRRLTLSDGKITHEASFQTINERGGADKTEN